MVLLLTSGCTKKPYYGELSTAGNYNSVTSVVDIAYNWGKYNAYTVPEHSRQQHEMCVYFALDNLNLGESCDWYANDNSASGVVKVIAHRPSGSGWCTTLFNTVRYKGKSREWQKIACVKKPGKDWYWVNK